MSTNGINLFTTPQTTSTSPTPQTPQDGGFNQGGVSEPLINTSTQPQNRGSMENLMGRNRADVTSRDGGALDIDGNNYEVTQTVVEKNNGNTPPATTGKPAAPAAPPKTEREFSDAQINNFTNKLVDNEIKAKFKGLTPSAQDGMIKHFQDSPQTVSKLLNAYNSETNFEFTTNQDGTTSMTAHDKKSGSKINFTNVDQLKNDDFNISSDFFYTDNDSSSGKKRTCKTVYTVDGADINQTFECYNNKNSLHSAGLKLGANATCQGIRITGDRLPFGKVMMQHTVEFPENRTQAYNCPVKVDKAAIQHNNSNDTLLIVKQGDSYATVECKDANRTLKVYRTKIEGNGGMPLEFHRHYGK